MIGIKDQCFGVEIELTGITREDAARALAACFETTPQYEKNPFSCIDGAVCTKIKQAGMWI